MISDEQVRYDYVPHAFALCAKKHNIKLGALHTTPCYIVDTSRPIEALGCFEPEAIVLPIESLPTNCTPDFEIPGGLYATCTFAGSFKLMEKHYARILDYIHDQGYQEKPGALEFCLIGEYESNDQKEYVSRLEVPVSLRN